MELAAVAAPPQWFGRVRLDDEIGHCCECGLRAPVEVTTSDAGTTAVHRCARHSPATGPCARCGSGGRRVPSGSPTLDRYGCAVHHADLVQDDGLAGLPGPPPIARPVLAWSYGGTAPPEVSGRSAGRTGRAAP
jgi:hypothetical protein